MTLDLEVKKIKGHFFACARSGRGAFLLPISDAHGKMIANRKGLAKSGFFGQDDVVLDYSCGKGRVGFFLSYRTKAQAIGIEYNDLFTGNAPRERIMNETEKLEFHIGGNVMEWAITFAVCFAVFSAIGIKVFWKKK